MPLRRWLRRPSSKEHLKPPKDTYRVLRTDTTNTANILARARDAEQVEKVTIAAQQIEQIWTGENRNLLKAMLMIDATYPHLEKMADLAPMSAEWMSEWSKAMEVASEWRAEE